MVGSVMSNINTTLKPSILIPVYNHETAIGKMLQSVLHYGVPILLVDDGSDVICKKMLEQITEHNKSQVSLIRLNRNSGKGAAVKAGINWLHKQKFTHALQIDADGQHNVEDIKQFLKVASQHPQRFITGCPEYDDSVPKVRFYCRYLTHFWVWVNTLSFKIKDSMCGFRVYPVSEVQPLLSQCGNRMDFDTEVIVRWVWRGGDVINLPTRVHYPSDGVSHYLLWKDNFLMTLMHIRLFFGMVIRSPRLIWRKFNV